MGALTAICDARRQSVIFRIILLCHNQSFDVSISAASVGHRSVLYLAILGSCRLQFYVRPQSSQINVGEHFAELFGQGANHYHGGVAMLKTVDILVICPTSFQLGVQNTTVG